MMEAKFFDVIFWGSLSAFITSLIWLIVGIIWSMIRKGKWIEVGRELEREKKTEFKKTSGTRRVKNFWCALGCGSYVSQRALDGHIYTSHGVEDVDELIAQIPTVFAPIKSKQPKPKV